MAELKPCPFCGGTAIELNRKTRENFAFINGVVKRRTLSERFQIKCENCPCGTYFGFYLEDVIEAWNRRAEDGK